MSLKVCFILEETRQEIESQGEENELLTQIAYRAGVTIQQTCGGSPSCTDCKIQLLSDDLDCFSKMDFAEKNLLGNVFHVTKERLACQTHIKKTCKILVPTPRITHKNT